jgi:hypothetical protein
MSVIIIIMIVKNKYFFIMEQKQISCTGSKQPMTAFVAKVMPNASQWLQLLYTKFGHCRISIYLVVESCVSFMKCMTLQR